MLYEWFGAHGFGIDFQQGHVDFATELAANNSLPHKFCLGDMKDLDWLPSDYFDHVISVAAFMYFRGDGSTDAACKSVANALRSMKAGGVFHLGFNTHMYSGAKQMLECQTVINQAESVKARGWKVDVDFFYEGSDAWCGNCSHRNVTGYLLRKKQNV